MNQLKCAYLGSWTSLALVVGLTLSGCSSDSSSQENSAGSGGSGGVAGGSAVGGSSGGTSAGGASLGGASSGGTGVGGTSLGGASSGGASSGGASAGGASAGGASSGGSGMGGRQTGGAGTGGAAAGGRSAGGAQNGGASTGGAAMGGEDAGGSAGSGGQDVIPSSGCNKTPTLSNGTITMGSRNYIINIPSNYDNSHPYRLILGFHGAMGQASDISGDYFGLLPLSEKSTIFIAANAVGGLWSADTDVTYVDDILDQVTADLCIDTSRIMLEGFSQGAAMSWTITCSRPGVFRAVVGHSGGGVANPTDCEPVAYLGSLGLGESGNSQATQTDQFARWNGCTVETLPTAPTGGHVCTNYSGCPDADPVRWCSYDGGHTPSPTDAGQGSSWMPEEVWTFFSQF